MKVLFDYQIFSSQIYGGISRYFCELMKCFDNKTRLEFSLAIRYSNNHYLRQFGHSLSHSFLGGFSFRGQNKLLRFFNKQLSKHYISNAGYDIFHPTYYDPYFLDYIGNRPFVLTIYDMIHEIFNKDSNATDTLV
jgi:hypothetical protein